MTHEFIHLPMIHSFNEDILPCQLNSLNFERIGHTAIEQNLGWGDVFCVQNECRVNDQLDFPVAERSIVNRSPRFHHHVAIKQNAI